MDALVSLVIYLIGLVIFCAVLYAIIRSAVAQAIKDTLWHLEVGTRNAMKSGIQEALAELEKNKTETETKNG